MTVAPYTDPALSADERARDLLGRLSLRDKVGLMFQTIASPIPPDEVPQFAPGLGSLRDLIESGITHFNLHGSEDKPSVLAERYNLIQKIAVSCNGKIPVTLSSDPRHAFTHNPLSSIHAGCFSQWPEQLGLVAIGDENLMETYGDIVRQEYIAVGLRSALHPQVDLATQYLWSRISGGMGEDADLASRLVSAYIKGLQGDELSIGKTSVSACVKHFPGGGPQRDGHDCHMPWGAEQDYPGDNFEYHLKPFRASVDAGVRQVMPSYGKPMGTRYEEVGMAFNKAILTDLLREELGFEGIVLSDWCIINGFPESGDDALQAKAFGVEDLTPDERIVRCLEAGVDQIGGETCVDSLLNLVKNGRVPESRIDQSAFLLLREKFLLGLFDNPFVDVAKSDEIVGKPEFVKIGRQAQIDSLTLVKNQPGTDTDGRPILPLRKGISVYHEGFESFPEGVAQATSDPRAADVRIIRLQTPWEPMGKGPFARSFHHGRLDFDKDVLDRISALASHGPVVIDLYCDRPAILGSIDDDASAIVINYGVQESLLVSVLFGDDSPKGHLPFDLPRSMDAVKAKQLDVPFNSENPVYRCGFGLRY